MKTFKSEKWDMDADNDTFQELFQKPKKKNKSFDRQKKKAKKQIRELKKRISKTTTDETINLIKTPTTSSDFSKNKKRKQKSREQSKMMNQNPKQIDSFSLDTSSNQFIAKKKHSKPKQSNDETINLVKNAHKVLKNKNKKLKKLEKKLKDKMSRNENITGDTKQLNKQKNNNALLDIDMNKTKKKSKKKFKSLSDPNDSNTEGFVKKDPLKKPISKVKKLISNDQSFTENLLEQPKPSSLRIKKKAKFFEKLKDALHSTNMDKKPVQTLRQKMMEKLKAARFRFINEQIYTTDSKEAKKIFENDPDAFKAYHDGYRKQVKSWPMNPLDVVIDNVKKMPKTHVIADFGCGDAKLSKSVVQKVHSFDLVAVDDTVVACDMSKVPLENGSVDVAVFCLSLMGTNLRDYLFEANRVLKIGGVLKVAEVESRFEKVEDFIKGVQYFGFKNTWKDLSHNLFYFIDFKKEKNVSNRNKLPTLSLLPCLYKKR